MSDVLQTCYKWSLLPDFTLASLAPTATVLDFRRLSDKFRQMKMFIVARLLLGVSVLNGQYVSFLHYSMRAIS